jgi:hypothetical protein
LHKIDIMKLYKALKLKKKLVGEITKLKNQIDNKNSYVVGSLNSEKFNVNDLYNELLTKVEDLVGLKFAINEANRDIQSKIYVISEYKALLTFLNNVPVVEGIRAMGYGEKIQQEYRVQIDEQKRDEFMNQFQLKIDALQEEIDIYNYTTEIPWDKFEE